MYAAFDENELPHDCLHQAHTADPAHGHNTHGSTSNMASWPKVLVSVCGNQNADEPLEPGLLPFHHLVLWDSPCSVQDHLALMIMEDVFLLYFYPRSSQLQL